jgi:hypothetical protein
MFSVDHHHLGFGNSQTVYGFGKYPPGEAFALSPSPVQPFECTLHSPFVKTP